MCLLETHIQESRWFPLVWGFGVWDGAWMEPEQTTTSYHEGFNFLCCLWAQHNFITLFKDKTRQDKIVFIPFRMVSETNEYFNVTVFVNKL